MARHSVIAAFDSRAEAERAVNRLAERGFDAGTIRTTADETAAASMEAAAQGYAPLSWEDEGVAPRVKHFFAMLFGGDDSPKREVPYYSEVVRRGGALVSVTVGSGDEAEKAADVLDECGAINIRERGEEWTRSGWARPAVASSDLAGSAPRRSAEPTPAVNEPQPEMEARERGTAFIYMHVTDETVVSGTRARDEEHGEGNYQATHEYDEATKQFVESGKVEDAARKAEPKTVKEGREMLDAEEKGKSRARSKDV